MALERLSPQNSERDRAFQEAMRALEQRIGYTFSNKKLLEQALTFSSFRSQSETRIQANFPLESQGDWLFEGYLKSWLNKIPRMRGEELERTASFLRSNLYLSMVGMCVLKLNLAVRHGAPAVRMRNPESQIRLTANALEALMHAINEDGGADAFNKFMKKFVLPPAAPGSAMQVILDFCSHKADKVQKSFNIISRKKAALAVHRDGTVYRGMAFMNGEEVEFTHRKTVDEALHRAGFKLLQSRPWVAWGFEDEAQVYVPHASTLSEDIPQHGWFTTHTPAQPADAK